MGCNDTDCLNCKRPVCLLDLEEEEPLIGNKNTKDRKEYMRMKYLERKQKSLHDNECKWCGKKCQGEMIRIHSKNYCGINCVLCHLYEANEKQMKIVVV